MSLGLQDGAFLLTEDLKRQAHAVRAAILRYAEAYEGLQSLQESAAALIPIGDQKTGCIGEFYVNLYLRGLSPALIKYANASNSGWDIEVTGQGETRRIQVKTVSAYSATRRISPIFVGWTELYLVCLGRNLQPEGFWVITDTSIVTEDRPIRHACAPTICGRKAGSAKLPLGPNRITEFLEYVNRVLEA